MMKESELQKLCAMLMQNKLVYFFLHSACDCSPHRTVYINFQELSRSETTTKPPERGGD